MKKYTVPLAGALLGTGMFFATKKKQETAKQTGLHVPYGPYEACVKRAFDLMLSAAALVIFCPVLMTLAILVRAKLGKPVLFCQERAGLYGKKFKIYKFRSMTDEKNELGEPLPDELRLTRFGKMLRSLSLDELPSFINVIKGELSLVGPRPLPAIYMDYYTKDEMHRHDVRPGITGLAQVNGRNYVTWQKKFAMDLEYVRKITFLADVRILFKTVKVVFVHNDIKTASKFEHNGVLYQPLDAERRK